MLNSIWLLSIEILWYKKILVSKSETLASSYIINPFNTENKVILMQCRRKRYLRNM